MPVDIRSGFMRWERPLCWRSNLGSLMLMSPNYSQVQRWCGDTKKSPATTSPAPMPTKANSQPVQRKETLFATSLMWFNRTKQNKSIGLCSPLGILDRLRAPGVQTHLSSCSPCHHRRKNTIWKDDPVYIMHSVIADPAYSIKFQEEVFN